MPKIRIKIGQLEIEYDGDQAFIEGGLVEFANQMASSLNSNPEIYAAELEESGTRIPSRTIYSTVSTNTIAQAIDAKTGSDLVVAAIAKIIIVNGAPSAGRHSILNEMKEATTYFKETYTSNLSSYLSTLVRGRRLNLVSKDTYAIPAAEKNRLEEAIRLSA